MKNRLDFLQILQEAANMAKFRPREMRKGAIIQQLEKVGLGPMSDISGHTNPLVAFALASVLNPEDYFSMRIAEEEAWQYFHKKYGSEWRVVPAGLVGGNSSRLHSFDQDAGYGHGV